MKAFILPLVYSLLQGESQECLANICFPIYAWRSPIGPCLTIERGAVKITPR